MKQLRESAGLTQGEVAERTGVGISTVQRLEAGTVKPRYVTIVTLLDFYRVTGELRGEMLALAKGAGGRGEGDLPEMLAAYIDFESEAKRLLLFEPLIVPGLLQTERYARAVVRGVLASAPDRDVERRVAARVQRRGALDKPDPLQVWALMDEAVIRREVGSQAIMAEQLRALVEASGRPNIQLQIIPYSAGAHPGMVGSFVVMDFADPGVDPTIVYTDSMAGDLFLEKESDVRRYSDYFATLRTMALSQAESVALLESTAAAMESASGGEEVDQHGGPQSGSVAQKQPVKRKRPMR